MAAGKQKILLVDDNPEDRFLITHALTEAGLDCEIHEASDGEEAERYLLQGMTDGNLPHTVILDLRLPKRSGREVIESLFAIGLTKQTRVIVLSSILAESETAHLLELGASAVYQKPMDLDQFAALGRSVKELSLPKGFASSRHAEPKGRSAA